MIIDAHVHLRDDVYMGEEATPENIIKMMDSVGIDKSVVFRIWTSTELSIESGEIAMKMYPDRLIPYVYAVPRYDVAVVDQIEQALQKKNFRGIKIHKGDCQLKDYIINPVLELAKTYNVPCLIDCLGDYETMKRILNNFYSVNIIIAHFGKYLCTDEKLIDQFIELAKEYNNAFLDTSGVVIPEKIKKAVHEIGSERIIFGTDGPVKAPDTISFVKKEINKIMSLNLTDEQQEDIFSRTISSLLRLK